MVALTGSNSQVFYVTVPCKIYVPAPFFMQCMLNFCNICIILYVCFINWRAERKPRAGKGRCEKIQADWRGQKQRNEREMGEMCIFSILQFTPFTKTSISIVYNIYGCFDAGPSLADVDMQWLIDFRTCFASKINFENQKLRII